MKVLVGRWEVELKRLLGKTQKQLMIISPFVTGVAVDILRPVAEGDRVACKLITRLNLNDFRSGVSDLGALKQLVEMGVEVRTLKRLHAKVYVFDDREAVVTSANFTGGGLTNEHEWGILVSRDECVEVFEEADALWNRLRITLRTSDLDANSRTLEEYRQSHPVVEIEESDLLPDEGESPLSHDESELEIALVPQRIARVDRERN